MKINTLFQDFVSLILPNYCLACEQGLESNEELICTTCLFKLPKTDFHLDPENEVSRKFVRRVTVTSAQAFLRFRKRGKVQKLIHKLKYEGYPEIGLLLGKLYGGQLREADWISDVDLIAPVPLHPKKLKTRGYNQSDGFAEGLSEVLNIPWQADLLYRTQHNESQTRKDTLARIKGAEKKFALTAPDSVKNKHILLADDVLTTGATLESCAQTLLNEQARAVSLATIAFASDI